MDGLIQDQDDVAFAIFDQPALDDATAAGVARYKQQVPGSTKKQSPHWNTDIVDAMVNEGKVRARRRSRELAAALGLPGRSFAGDRGAGEPVGRQRRGRRST